MNGSRSTRDGIPAPLLVCGCSDRGSVRDHNEDYFGYYIPTEAALWKNRGSLFAVSDGVGGSAAGDVASAEAVNVLLQEYYFGQHDQNPPDRLKHAFQAAALHIYDLSASHASVRHMKCTLTTLLLQHNRFFITHVGDSKILLLRQERIIQLTKDHNLAGKLLRLGLITAEDARNHAHKNRLLRAVGESPLLVPDFYSGMVKPEDLFILVTDGILEHATQDELKTFLLEYGFHDQGLNQIVAELNRRGGFDNMTILTVKVNQVPC